MMYAITPCDGHNEHHVDVQVEDPPDDQHFVLLLYTVGGIRCDVHYRL